MHSEVQIPAPFTSSLHIARPICASGSFCCEEMSSIEERRRRERSFGTGACGNSFMEVTFLQLLARCFSVRKELHIAIAVEVERNVKREFGLVLQFGAEALVLGDASTKGG